MEYLELITDHAARNEIIYGFFADMLRACRIRARLTQDEMAQLLDMSQPYLSEIENGRRVNFDLLLNLSRVMGISTDELLGFPNRTDPHIMRIDRMLVGRDEVDLTAAENVLTAFLDVMDNARIELRNELSDPKARKRLVDSLTRRPRKAKEMAVFSRERLMQTEIAAEEPAAYMKNPEK